jgi:hypothetical protein
MGGLGPTNPLGLQRSAEPQSRRREEVVTIGNASVAANMDRYQSRQSLGHFLPIVTTDESPW